MKLVLLAAGHGKRFGGLKQIAPVGPNGEAIMDYTVRFAEECGYDGIVLVVREAIREEIAAHVRRRWTGALPVEMVVQPQRPGTAYAVLCTQPVIDGPFAIANADDLYESHALRTIREHFEAAATGADADPAAHVLVAYELTKTVLTDAEVKRGLCTVSRSGALKRVAEHRVHLRSDGTFYAVPLAEQGLHNVETWPLILAGAEPVSMNLWGFSTDIFADLAEATEPYEPGGPDHEILLPEVVGSLVSSHRTAVQVVTTASRCYGVTHREDVPLVREHLEVAYGSEDTSDSRLTVDT